MIEKVSEHRNSKSFNCECIKNLKASVGNVSHIYHKTPEIYKIGWKFKTGAESFQLWSIDLSRSEGWFTRPMLPKYVMVLKLLWPASLKNHPLTRLEIWKSCFEFSTNNIATWPARVTHKISVFLIKFKFLCIWKIWTKECLDKYWKTNHCNLFITNF